MSGNYFFTSEAVSNGHPDKIADQISDAVLDACLSADRNAKVACETLVSSGLVILAGEITADCTLDYQQIARDTIREIGYDRAELGFDYRSCAVITALNKQSPDIAQGVLEGQGLFSEQGAGDQGLMFGFACDDTKELMPLPIMLAHRIVDELRRIRESSGLSYLRPDAKSQVTVEYDENHHPVRVDTVVLSTQHAEEVSYETLVADMKSMIQRVVPEYLLDSETSYFINPTGRFVIGGPVGDCGLTGRKIIVDTYGGMGRHGGGAFSGKDPSKVDRSGAYAARYVAKNIVAAKLAQRCEVQISYAIGVPYPTSVEIDTLGTAQDCSEEILSQVVGEVFDLSPRGIVEMLDLKRPIYRKTAIGGHFGRPDPDFTWEQTNRVHALQEAVSRHMTAV